MRRFSWELQFGLSLILLSVVLYLFHYALFEDARHILLWTTTSVAFLPISVLFVTLIINRLLMRRERHLIMDKLNVLIEINRNIAAGLMANPEDAAVVARPTAAPPARPDYTALKSDIVT